MEIEPLSTTRRIREIGVVSGYAVAYFLAHHIAFFFPDSENVIMSIRPAGGIGPASLLLSPYRRWPYLALAFYLSGITADVAIANRPFLAGVGISAMALIPDASPLGGIDLDHRLIALQIFLGFAASTGFLLAATYAETRAAEEASRIDHERLRILGDNLPNGMVYQLRLNTDGTRQFLYVSRGVERVNGVTADEVLSNPAVLYGLVVDEDRPYLAALEDESAGTLGVFNTNVRFRRKDGEIRWMQLASSPRRQADGTIIRDGISDGHHRPISSGGSPARKRQALPGAAIQSPKDRVPRRPGRRHCARFQQPARRYLRLRGYGLRGIARRKGRHVPEQGDEFNRPRPRVDRTDADLFQGRRSRSQSRISLFTDSGGSPVRSKQFQCVGAFFHFRRP